jgi:hypothetical protein
MKHVLRVLAVCATAVSSAIAQAKEISDSQAVLLATQAQAAMGGGAVSDVVLNANAQWTIGGTSASGSATLKAKGLTEARLDITAGAVSRSEIRNDANGPGGQWIGPDGTHHPIAPHNCWAPAPWFAPHGMVQAMSAVNAVLHFAGRETRNGISVDHVQFHPANIEKDPELARELEKLATADVYFDASTHLPAALLFNTHPDNDTGRDIPVEIRFSDYRNVEGVMVPFHIRRYLQGVLNLDLTVTAATINQGLADSEFALQ